MASASGSAYACISVTPDHFKNLATANNELNMTVATFPMSDRHPSNVQNIANSVNSLVQTYGYPLVIATLERQALACGVRDDQVIIISVQDIIKATRLPVLANARQAIIDSIATIYEQIKSTQEHLTTRRNMGAAAAAPASDEMPVADQNALIQELFTANSSQLTEAAGGVKQGNPATFVPLVAPILGILAEAPAVASASLTLKESIAFGIAIAIYKSLLPLDKSYYLDITEDLKTAFEPALSNAEITKLFTENEGALEQSITNLVDAAKAGDKTSITTAVASLVFTIIPMIAHAKDLYNAPSSIKQTVATGIAINSINRWVQDEQLKEELDAAVPGAVAMLMFAGQAVEAAITTSSACCHRDAAQQQPAARGAAPSHAVRMVPPPRQRHKCIVL